ncbi:MAG: histidinol dehydrogenase [Gemmatales bacterium]|nr:histidinol dehydrogenase [Gemmatales bacterium]
MRRLDVSSHGDVPALVHEIRRQRGLEAEVLTPRQRELTMRLFGEPLPPVRSVERICREVQELGFSAVARFSRLLDEYELTPERLRVTEAELQEAHAKVSAEFLRTVRHVRERLFTFQTGLLYSDVVWRQNGEEIRVRYRPVRRVGIHIPGGSAAYPSTLLMTVVPAQAAGVREIAVIAPPTRFGSNNPELLAVCYELGIREVYRLGGAHGIAALAYGMEGLPRVDMIVGPGNLFVTLAKKYVFGTVGIDLLAGPTEVVILADDSAHPQYLAADLLAQAEHAPGSSILITWRAELLDAVQHALEEQLRCLERGELTRDSLERFGAFVRTQDADQAVDLANLLAPEHLQVCARQAEALLERVENAGAVFLGNTTPEAVGDYLAGPSHVLPTGGTARFASGLSANDFLRRTSVIRFDATALRREAEHIIRLATVEHLPAHAESVRVRLADLPSSATPTS